MKLEQSEKDKIEKLAAELLKTTAAKADPPKPKAEPVEKQEEKPKPMTAAE